jgi:hypothetical protein
MAIAIAIPFPRPADRATGHRPRRASPIAAQPGARVYSPYGRRRLARPMAVPHAGAVAGAAALRVTGGQLRLPFFRARRG